MITEMLTDQVFRVKGLAGRADELEIALTAFYGGGKAPETRIADLVGGECALDGLGIVISGDSLDVGKSFRGGITGFLLEITGKTRDAGEMQLKYAVCNAADLMKSDFYPQYERLDQSKIRFTLDGGRFVIEAAGAGNESDAAAAGSEANYSLADIIGNIGADLEMIALYPNSREREELEAALTELLRRAESESAAGNEAAAGELDAAVTEREKRIAEYIGSSAERFKGSGRHLLEKTAGRGR